jgi:hypothetical protein
MKISMLLFLLVLFTIITLAQNNNSIKAKFGKLYSHNIAKEVLFSSDTMTQKELQKIERIIFVDNNSRNLACKFTSCKIYYAPRRGEIAEMFLTKDSLKSNLNYLGMINSAGYGSKIYIENIHYNLNGTTYKISGGFQIYIKETYKPELLHLQKNSESFK